MASCFNSSCFYIIFVIFLLNDNHFIVSVKGDLPLVNEVCGKTTEPNYCIKCMYSDPTGLSTDLFGFGGVIITCARTQADKTQGVLIAYGDTTVDPELKVAVATCASLYETIKNSLKYAMELWQRRSFADAGNQASESRKLFVQCVLGLPKKVEYPPEFTEAIVSSRASLKTIEEVMPQMH